MSVLLGVLKKRRVSSFMAMIMLGFPVFLYIFYDNRGFDPALVQRDEIKLIIDAGHGGIDSGAIAQDGSKESDINLAIALKLRALAEFFGQDNVMIRQDDSTLSDSSEYSEHRDLV